MRHAPGTDDLAEPTELAPLRRPIGLILKQLTVITLFVGGLGLFVFSYSIFPILLKSGVLDGMLQAEMSRILGGKVSFAGVEVIRPGTVSMQHLHIQGMHPTLTHIYCPHVEAQMGGGALPFLAIRSVTMSSPQVEVSVDLDWLRSVLEGAQKGLTLNIRGPSSLPQVRVDHALVYGHLGQQSFVIRDIQGHLDNPDGFHLPFQVSGTPKGENQDVVTASGALHLTPTSGHLEIKEFRSSIHALALQLESDPSSASPIRATVDVSTLQIAKSLKSFLSEFLGIDIQAILSAGATFEISRDGYEQLELHGKIDSYSFVGRRIDIRDQKVPLSLSIALRKKIGATDWMGHIMLENIKTMVHQTVAFEVRRLEIPFQLSGSDEVLHPSGDIHFLGCSFVEQRSGLELLGFDASVNFNMDVNPREQTAQGRIVARIGQTAKDGSKPVEILLGSGDLLTFDKTALEVIFDGTIDLKRRKAEFSELSISVTDLGKMYTKGFVGLGPRGLEYDLALTSRAIPASVLLSMARNLGWKILLDQMEGTVDIDAHAALTPHHFHASGSIEGRDVTAQAGPVSVHKTAFRLPFHLYAGEASERPADEEEGTISIGEIRMPEGAVRDLDIRIAARENFFALKYPLTFPLWGGSLNLSGFECGGLMTRPYLKGAFSFSKVDLGKMAAGVGFPYPVTGELHGYFDEISPDKDDLVFKGQAQAQVFGGNVVVHGVRIRNFLSDHASVACSMDLHDIRLEDICRTFTNFGLVRGNLVGHVYDLELYRGKISQVELDVHTEPRPGGKQKFDLKAVKKMAMLVEGPGSPILGQLSLAPDALYYDRLGMYARLRGNKILIRGKYYQQGSLWDFVKELKEHPLETLRRNGGIRKRRIEYIVHGSGWHQINVIIGDPGAMDTLENFVQRLERMLKGE